MSTLLDWLVANDPNFRKSRLPSLYSDLSVQRSTNPEGYSANLTAWVGALTHLALAAKLPLEQRLILSVNDDLLNALASSQYGRPECLGVVLDDAVRSGKMIDLKDFTSADKSIYSKSWLPSPWAVLRWSLRQAGILGDNSYNISGRLRQGRLVLVPALEDAAKKIKAWAEQHNSTLTDRIWTRDAFAKEISSLLVPPDSNASPSQPTLQSSDLDILLQYLQRDTHLLSSSSTTVKLTSHSSTPTPVTSSDESIANLKSLITSLTAQTTTLSTRISTLQTQAANAVTNHNKPLALSALRSKRLALRALDMRTAQLSQLEDVYAQIEQAADNLQVVSTLESSADVLKGLNAKVGGVERVDSIMDGLREEMEKTSEVGSVLNESLLSTTEQGVVEGEVDEELERMEREEKEKEERERDARGLEERLKGLQGVEQVRNENQNTENLNQNQNKDLEVDVDGELAKSVEKMQHLDLGEQRVAERA